jgi:hypothetical protein
MPKKIKALKLIDCTDPMLWYAKLNLGDTLPYVRDDPLDPSVFISREPEGYINIVYKKDVEPIYEDV